MIEDKVSTQRVLSFEAPSLHDVGKNAELAVLLLLLRFVELWVLAVTPSLSPSKRQSAPSH